MANKVTVHVMGGESQIVDNVSSVGDLKTQLGLSEYTAVVNGDPATDTTELGDFSRVTLTKSVKGGM